MDNNSKKNRQDFKYRSTIELSIRRKDIQGLPGDDPTLHNIKIGSSLKGNGPLRGLDYDEETEYLPDIIGISPNDTEWRRTVKDYWNNISVSIPADGTTIGKLQGKVLAFIIAFKTEGEKQNFEKVLSLDEKAKIAKNGLVLDGVDDYILWRYCLVYGKVANRYEDIRKSPKILFYLYSKETETRVEHNAFKLRVKAGNLFTEILMKDSIIDAVLLMFEQTLTHFESRADKHLALEVLIKSKPAVFIKFMEDGNLETKAIIKKAVDAHIIHQPSNTDSYYYGEGNEVCLGTTLMDAVIYWKSTEKINKEIVDAIKARLNQI